MRHVYNSHEEVAHVWANNRHEVGHGRGFNVYFNGDTIYSYGGHFPVARIIQRPDGEGEAVLFTSRSRSISAAKHKSIVSRACHHLPTFTVRDPSSSDWAAHAKEALEEAKELRLKAARRRKVYLQAYDLADATRRLEEARTFAIWGGFELPASDEEAFAEIERQEAAAREAARIESERRGAEQLELAVKAEALWERAKPFWRAHEPIPADIMEEAQQQGLGFQSLVYGSVAMRVTPDGTEIETSQRARFPVDHGVRAFRVLKGLWSRDKTWTRNHGVGPRLGHYRIDEVTAEGVRAGCHFVPRAEVELMAERLDVANIAPADVAEAVDA